ncbi:hypothetical protein ACOME3_010227 [Neoechinorhynchus agilis]
MDPGFDYQFRLIKTVAIEGDSTVGKSSLLRNFCDGKLCEETEPTVGVDFYARIVNLPASNHPKLKLQLWDTAGQERFRSITRSYYRNSAGVLLVYDITKRVTFEHIPTWLNEAKAQISPFEAAYLLVGTKMDLDIERQVSVEEASAFAASRDLKFIETSAKTGANVSQAFLMIARELYELSESGHMSPCNEWDGMKRGKPVSDSTRSKRRFDSTINLSNSCVQPTRCCTS